MTWRRRLRICCRPTAPASSRRIGPCSPEWRWPSPSTPRPRGQPSESAEILGAAARLRGSGDEHDIQIARLRSGLIETLGSNEFEAAYGAGRSLSPDAASKRVDPTPLLVRAGDPIDAQARLR